MAKIIVLLDVDETIWFHSHPNALNLELVHRLIELGATDVFLFTDMTLDSKIVQHRIAVIQALERLGLKIHGVITPSDIFWNNVLINVDILNPGKTRKYIDVALTNNNPGTAYEIALNEIRTEGMVSKVNTNKSRFISRQVLPAIASIFNYQHQKGLLFELFLKHLSEDTQKIIVIDDKFSVLATIRKICEQLKSFLDSKNLIIDTIHVQQKNKGVYYNTESGKRNLSLHQNSPYIISNLDLNTLQRKDVIRVTQEIARLKQANTPFFKDSRQIKAHRIVILP